MSGAAEGKGLFATGNGEHLQRYRNGRGIWAITTQTTKAPTPNGTGIGSTPLHMATSTRSYSQLRATEP